MAKFKVKVIKRSMIYEEGYHIIEAERRLEAIEAAENLDLPEEMTIIDRDMRDVDYEIDDE